MKDKKKGKIYNRLFFRVYINYATMVLLFASILGVVYLNLSEKNVINTFRDRLFEQARAVSKNFTEFIVNEEYDSYYSYIEILHEMGADEIWSVANPNAKIPMNPIMEFSIVMESATSSENYNEILQNAFLSKESYATNYSQYHGCDVVTIGVPVLGTNGEVCGAILVNAAVENQIEAIRSTKSLVFSSAIIALVISFILAIILAGQISRPISKMRQTALALADKRYEVKTGISRKDEIGDLAKTIDFLTDKLVENEKIRTNLEQMRMDFFANVSHELRTPITVVRAYTESLVDGVITEESAKQQYYEKMLSECKGMERLVGDLLTLAKMQNPDFTVENEPVNLVQVFDDIVRAVKAIGEEKNIKIQMSYNNSVCLMMGDYDRLRQMFMIICDNAIKFSNENSTIHIEIEYNDTIVVKVRDEGIGISKEDIDNIFDKFYKSKLRQNAKGSGLGLAIAKQIALKHDGTIEVNSTLKVGTEFVFTFHKATQEELEA